MDTSFAHIGPGARLSETDEASTKNPRQGAEGPPRVANSESDRCDFLLRITRDLLDAYAYSGLLEILDRESCSGKEDHFRYVRALLRHGVARLNLSFEEAANILRGATRDGVLAASTTELFIDTANHSSYTLQRPYEIFWTARVFLSRSDFGNFAVRAAMLLETVRQQLLYLLTGIEGRVPLVSPNRLDSELNQRLEAAGMHKQNGDWSNTKQFQKTCIEWGKEQLSDRTASEAASGVQKCIADLKPLEELRNSFVHQSKGISESDIESHWSSVDDLRFALMHLLRKMDGLHGQLGKQVEGPTDIYTELNRAIFDALQTKIILR